MGKVIFICAALWVVGVVFHSIYMFTDESMQKFNVATMGSSTLHTISTDKGKNRENQNVNCETDFCSWKHYQTNDEYKNKTNHLLYELADEDLYSFIDSRDPNLTCLPESFGYTREEAVKIFPDVDFPTCKKKIGEKEQIIEISIDGVLTMHCSKGKGWYWVGTNPREETLGFYNYEGKRQKYDGPVQLGNEEWAYGT